MPPYAGSARCALFAALAGFSVAAAHADGPAHPPVMPKAANAAPVPLAAHRALYRVTLLKSTGNKSPTSARGRVSNEFSGSSCDGYSQVFRQITELQPAEGNTRLSDTRSATFEDADGKAFSFDVKTSVDNAAPDVVDGHADRRRNDMLAIRLSKPAAQTVDVDDAVLFPTGHLMRIIAAAEAGQQIVQAKVFDGSDDGKKVYDTTAVIGHQLASAADDLGAAHVQAMDSLRRWPVTISYFEGSKKDGRAGLHARFRALRERCLPRPALRLWRLRPSPANWRRWNCCRSRPAGAS